MNIPSHVGKSPEEIIRIEYFDSAGYFFKSMAWLDYFSRARNFSPLLYACADARHGIEYLLFEELVISTGANLSAADYRKCVNERKRFIKTIEKLTQDYDRLKQFTRIVVGFEPRAPKLIDWDHRALMKAWGEVSHYLHWFGARTLTTEKQDWLNTAFTEIKKIVEPLWTNITSGQSGIMHPKDMHPTVREIWNEFREGKIDASGVQFRLQFLEPLHKDV